MNKVCVKCSREVDRAAFKTQGNGELYMCPDCKAPNYLVIPKTLRGKFTSYQLIVGALVFLPTILFVAYSLYWYFSGGSGLIIIGTFTLPISYFLYRVLIRPVFWKYSEFRATTFED